MNFHPGQTRAWNSDARFLAILAGTRSGKTAFSPHWLRREMKRKGAGEYLGCGPSYPLLDRALVPALHEFLVRRLGLGKMTGGTNCPRFEMSPAGEWAMWQARQDKPTRIIFGHGDQPDSLEAAQYKAAVCDEAGQKRFKAESWEAIQRRLAIDKGRALFPTTPYAGFGWMKDEIHDRAVRRLEALRAGRPVAKADADYDLVSFESVENPAFPLDEWDRAMATLPDWKFDLFYRGIFTKPAGAIYDCFEPRYHVVHPGDLVGWADGKPPAHWTRGLGMDFGSPNFVGLWLAQEHDDLGPDAAGQTVYRPTGRWVVYREYWPDEAKTAAAHVEGMMAGEARPPDECVGGSRSEGQWRAEFQAAGLLVGEPDQPDVEVGILRVYAAFKAGELFVSSACPKLVRQLQEYAREVDELGNAENAIEDKEKFHGPDALRYIVGWLKRPGGGLDVW